MNGLMSDPRENSQQPEDDGSLHHWMMCEEKLYELHASHLIQPDKDDDDDSDSEPIGFDDPPPF